MNIAPEFKDQARIAPDDDGCAARDMAKQAIVIRFGIAGSIIAAAIGYLIERDATGGAAGFADAIVCPALFIAVYQSFAQRGG